MTTRPTPFGTINILSKEEIFAAKAELLAALPDGATVALTGGSTPKGFYRWITKPENLDKANFGKLNWTVSDERHVPHFHADNNFGVAASLFLEPLAIPGTQLHPWPTQHDPKTAAATYAASWATKFGADRTYDVCFVGMGDDGHTLSLFPGSPLLEADSSDAAELFTAIEVPEKGWRLTLTPAGLRHCSQVHVLVVGESKASILKKVFETPINPSTYPVQILSEIAEKVTWWVDLEAAAQIV